MTANNRPDVVYDCHVRNGGTGYANTDTVVFTADSGSAQTSPAAATITTDANGTIIDCTLTNNGDGYATAPAVSVTTGGGTGAVIEAELGGFIPIPENIIGVVRLFPFRESNSSTNNIFSIRYQIALNDLYTITANSIVPYFMTFQHLRLIAPGDRDWETTEQRL